MYTNSFIETLILKILYMIPFTVQIIIFLLKYHEIINEIKTTEGGIYILLVSLPFEMVIILTFYWGLKVIVSIRIVKDEIFVKSFRAWNKLEKNSIKKIIL